MNLENEVRTVMSQSADALTVDQVTREVAKRMEGEIRLILNNLFKNGELKSIHGGGSYPTFYKARPIKRRA